LTAIVGLDLLYEVPQSHTIINATLGRTTLEEWSARRRYLYLAAYNNHKRQSSMPTSGFEPAIPISQRP